MDSSAETLHESSASVRKANAGGCEQGVDSELPCSKRPKIESSENEDSVAEVTSSVGSSSSVSSPRAGDGASTGTEGSQQEKDASRDGGSEEEEEGAGDSDSQPEAPPAAGQEDEEEEQQQQQQQDRLDREQLDLEADETNSDDENLFQQILAAARAGRIPLEYLAASGIHLDFDDGPVDYPFESPPTSIRDVASFIRSENCQRILVLAG